MTLLKEVVSNSIVIESNLEKAIKDLKSDSKNPDVAKMIKQIEDFMKANPLQAGYSKKSIEDMKKELPAAKHEKRFAGLTDD